MPRHTQPEEITWTPDIVQRKKWILKNLLALKELEENVVSLTSELLTLHSIEIEDDLPWIMDKDASTAMCFGLPCAPATLERQFTRIEEAYKQETNNKFEFVVFPKHIIEDLELEALSLEEWQQRHFSEFLHESPASVKRESWLTPYRKASGIHSFVECLLFNRGDGRYKGLLESSRWRRLNFNEDVPPAEHWYHREREHGREFPYSMTRILRPLPWPQPKQKDPQYDADAERPMGYHCFLHGDDLVKYGKVKSLSHLACTLATGTEGQDNVLLKSEMIAAHRLILDQMSNLYNHEHEVFPVFIYSFVSLKVRVLQVYFNPVSMRVHARMTSLLPIEGLHHMANVKKLLAWILNQPCGDTRQFIKHHVARGISIGAAEATLAEQPESPGIPAIQVQSQVNGAISIADCVSPPSEIPLTVIVDPAQECTVATTEAIDSEAQNLLEAQVRHEVEALTAAVVQRTTPVVEQPRVLIPWRVTERVLTDLATLVNAIEWKAELAQTLTNPAGAEDLLRKLESLRHQAHREEQKLRIDSLKRQLMQRITRYQRIMVRYPPQDGQDVPMQDANIVSVNGATSKAAIVAAQPGTCRCRRVACKDSYCRKAVARARQSRGSRRHAVRGKVLSAASERPSRN